MLYTFRELQILCNGLDLLIRTLKKSGDFPEEKEYKELMKKLISNKYDKSKGGE